MSVRALSFGPVAEAYERFRPGYPEELFDLVMAYAGHPVRTALEIGAGTGKATRLFARPGITVTATEPDPAMLAELRKHVPPSVRAVRAALEDLPAGGRRDLAGGSRERAGESREMAGEDSRGRSGGESRALFDGGRNHLSDGESRGLFAGGRNHLSDGESRGLFDGQHRDPVGGERHDLFYVAAALHWTRPEGRWERIAGLLRPGGVFASCGGPVQLADPAVAEAVRAARAPFLETDELPSPDGTPPEQEMQWPGTELEQSPLFEDVRQVTIGRRLTVSSRDYVGHLSTVSAYLTLPPAHRAEVYRRILAAVPDTLELTADIVVHLARRV
ncbi:class I SAM-dependent methyltransferase [Actinoplanes siamensis]|uniref:Methyltransferase domain-containing protein n=1 Tax=Actinoplanes siamensis TaxID=1223317 RepID=A0A919TIS4_9ACTN|nr:class I SAM-dependent methyltransferase [Actinoplanes siamensis]GIF03954.1 hypothetical protein Asi03nite_14920 [Actinoplanes siamensis]